eukprot:12085720-Ditylum_brightwellii.AAC.1
MIKLHDKGNFVVKSTNFNGTKEATSMNNEGVYGSVGFQGLLLCIHIVPKIVAYVAQNQPRQ